MRRASFALILLSGAALLSGCGNAGNSWSGEFKARLGGMSASIEETLVQLESDSTKPAKFRSYENLARELRYKRGLVEGLSAPSKCTEVQTRGVDHVRVLASRASQVRPPDFPTRMIVAARVSLEDDLRVLSRIEREAEACA